MHILHIDTEKTWRGGENQIRLLIEGLEGRGHKCSIATRKGSELARRMRKEDRAILEFSTFSELNLISAYHLSKYCRRQQVDIIDCHSSHSHSLGLLCKKYFIPKVKLVIHRRVDSKPKKGFLNTVKYLNPSIDAFVAISNAISDILKNAGVSKEKNFIVPSAVDKKIYNSLSRIEEKNRWYKLLKINNKTVLIGQAAAMTEQKGFPTLLHSLALLKKKNLDFHCAIAGDGALLSELTLLRKELGLEDFVTFLGWIDNVPSFLSSVDIFAMPSNNEGLGTVALEAQYAGCCVVACDVGGIKENVIHEKTGLLAKVKDTVEFSELLEKAVLDSNLRKNLNENGVRNCEENFSLDAMVSGNISVYQKLLQK